MLRPTLLLVLTLATGPALAGATPEQQVAPGATARLIASNTVVDGITYAALELRLPPGTHTYWRVPGETGIPPAIDFAGSAGLAAVQLLWPYPTIDSSSGYLDYVYEGDVVIPIRLTPDAGEATLRASVTLGICSDICVPAAANFSLPLAFGSRDTPAAIRIDAALARIPIDWDQPGAAFGPVTAAADGAAILVHAPAASIDPASLIADAGDPSLLFAAPQKSPDGALWTLKLLGKSADDGLVGRLLQLTFMTPRGPYAVVRIIGPAP